MRVLKMTRAAFPIDQPIWESVVAEVAFQGRTLNEITLHPISLGFGEPRSQRGRPRPASPELSEQIIKRVATLSAPLGTKVEFTGGRGVIELRRKTGSQ
jgi:hypothetical protein